MPEDPRDYRSRNSMRDPRIDYTRGNYFVTVCLAERRPLFGRIVEGSLELNAIGRKIEEIWLAMPEHNPGLVLDCHIVMPDHFHAVLGIVETRLTHPHLEVFPQRPDLSAVIGNFKRHSTKQYGVGVRELGWPPYDGQFWQPGFWDSSLDGEKDLEFHRQYVVSNPLRWHLKRQGLL